MKKQIKVKDFSFEDLRNKVIKYIEIYKDPKNMNHWIYENCLKEAEALTETNMRLVFLFKDKKEEYYIYKNMPKEYLDIEIYQIDIAGFISERNIWIRVDPFIIEDMFFFSQLLKERVKKLNGDYDAAIAYYRNKPNDWHNKDRREIYIEMLKEMKTNPPKEECISEETKRVRELIENATVENILDIARGKSTVTKDGVLWEPEGKE